MKLINKLFAVATVSLFVCSCGDQELPYDLDGVQHSFAVSVSKVVGTDLLLSAGSTDGNYQISLEVPMYMGDYKSDFKEAEVLCVYTNKLKEVSSTVVATGINSFPAQITLDMKQICDALGIASPAVGDKMQFTANVIHKDGTKVVGWNETMGFNNRNISWLYMEDGSDYNYCASYSAMAPLDMSKFATARDVNFTESVGGEYEASYPAHYTQLATIPDEVVKAGFTKEDYIGLELKYDWYAIGADVTYCIYINKKDYSVSAPQQTVYEDIDLGYGYGAGDIIFLNFSGEIDTETSIITYTATAYYVVSAGTLNFQADNYIVKF